VIYYLPLIASLLIYAIRMGEVNRKRELVAGKVQEKWTLRIFILVGTVMTFGSLVEYATRYLLPGRPFSLLAFVAGVICAVVSFKLRWAAIAALGRFWSLHVEIRDNHEFVQSGPFRWVRHPTYLSMVLELAAFGLICSAWYMLLFIPFVFIPALILRLRLEEPALVQKFGPAYTDYQRRVPMLLPYRWPRGE
jgi:protein-S-isoprenylcysteine O-methyltransferase Ste14